MAEIENRIRLKVNMKMSITLLLYTAAVEKIREFGLDRKQRFGFGWQVFIHVLFWNKNGMLSIHNGMNFRWSTLFTACVQDVGNFDQNKKFIWLLIYWSPFNLFANCHVSHSLSSSFVFWNNITRIKIVRKRYFARSIASIFNWHFTLTKSIRFRAEIKETHRSRTKTN